MATEWEEGWWKAGWRNGDGWSGPTEFVSKAEAEEKIEALQAALAAERERADIAEMVLRELEKGDSERIYLLRLWAAEQQQQAGGD
jgi:hypothetical protein